MKRNLLIGGIFVTLLVALALAQSVVQRVAAAHGGYHVPAALGLPVLLPMRTSSSG